MKTLEGQPALSYLERLSRTIQIDLHGQRSYSLENLLDALVSIELAFLKSFPAQSDDPIRITITATGFPSIPTTIAHVDSAIKLHQQKTGRQKRLAAKFLEAISSFNPDQISATAETLSESKNQHELIAQSLAKLNPNHVRFLQTINIQTRGNRMPFYTLDQFPGLLVSHAIDTPFSPFDKFDRKWDGPIHNYQYIRKFLDSPSFDPYFITGSPENPLKPNITYTVPPRPALIISGRIDKKLNPNKINLIETRLPNILGWFEREKVAPEVAGQENHQEKVSVIETIEFTHPVDRRLKEIFRSDNIVNTLVNIDFSNLSDHSADTIINNLSKVELHISQIKGEMEKLVQNLPPDLEKSKQASLDLSALIDAIEDPGAKGAIQLAVLRLLERTKDQLGLNT